MIFLLNIIKNYMNELGQSTPSTNLTPSFGSSNQSNEFIKILEAFPDKPWNWKLVLQNPNISLDYIESHPDFPWEMTTTFIFTSCNLSYNPNLTLQYILNNLDLKWRWEYIVGSSIITLEDIESNLTIRDGMTFEFWKCAGKNPNITLDFVLKHEHIFQNKNNSRYLGSQANITLQNIKDYPHLFWSKYALSQNPNITLEYILEHPDTPVDILNHNYWVWSDIMTNPNITFQDIENHPEVFNVDVYQGAIGPILFPTKLGPDTKMDFLMAHLSENQNITFDIITNNINYDWNHKYMCKNPSITMEQLEMYGLHKCNLDYLGSNPNLTLEFILNHPEIDFWDDRRKYEISENLFNCHPFFEVPIVIRV